MVQLVHGIISDLDGAVNHGHKQTDLIIMDFTEVFDKVLHRRLLGQKKNMSCFRLRLQKIEGR